MIGQSSAKRLLVVPKGFAGINFLFQNEAIRRFYG